MTSLNNQIPLSKAVLFATISFNKSWYMLRNF